MLSKQGDNRLVRKVTMRSYMEKLLIKGDTPIPSTAKLMVWITLFDKNSFSLPLAVQGQVPRYCTLPKGPISPPEQPGCYHRLDTGC